MGIKDYFKQKADEHEAKISQLAQLEEIQHEYIEPPDWWPENPFGDVDRQMNKFQMLAESATGNFRGIIYDRDQQILRCLKAHMDEVEDLKANRVQ